MTRQPITRTADGRPLRRPVTPRSRYDDLYACALVLDLHPDLNATRAQLIALIWPPEATS